MGKTYEALDDGIADFIRRQHVFFVATAPLAADGHVNVSPKGLDTFAIVDPHTVAYADLTGSGIETVAHLRENGRITLCFCAFEGPPRILRLHGSGSRRALFRCCSSLWPTDLVRVQASNQPRLLANLCAGNGMVLQW